VTVFRTKQADADIEDIATYIAQDSPNAAIRWVDEIEANLISIGEMPGIGVLRDDIRADLRTSALGNYIIVYREVDSDVEVVRVLHGARQWQDLL
jgi:toxin ParE1/3/4